MFAFAPGLLEAIACAARTITFRPSTSRARSSVVNGSLRGAKERRSFKPQVASSILAGRTLENPHGYAGFALSGRLQRTPLKRLTQPSSPGIGSIGSGPWIASKWRRSLRSGSGRSASRLKPTRLQHRHVSIRSVGHEQIDVLGRADVGMSDDSESADHDVRQISRIRGCHHTGEIRPRGLALGQDPPCTRRRASRPPLARASGRPPGVGRPEARGCSHRAAPALRR
jgi:hypothetical protein